MRRGIDLLVYQKLVIYMSDTIANACSVLTQFKHCNKLAARCDDHAMHHHHAMACIIIITALTP